MILHQVIRQKKRKKRDIPQTFEKLLLNSNTIAVKIKSNKKSNLDHWLLWSVKSFGFGTQLEARIDAFWPIIKRLSQENQIEVYGFKDPVGKVNSLSVNDLINSCPPSQSICINT